MADERASSLSPLPTRTNSRFHAADSAESLRQTIQALQQELIACQRLSMLGSLSAMVAHEFNNLLTPIVARSEAALLAEDVAFMRKSLERALVQSQRAMAVTRHLLDLARERPPAAPEACPVGSAVREALETLTRPLEKDSIALTLAIPDDLTIAARPDLFCQVILNLLLNARKAMAGKPGRLTISAAPQGRRAVIDIRDTGQGIPCELLETVFNPFLAADPFERPNDWQQVGLGLSVCRMIAHHHRATIQGLPNAGERGCTFRLCWPLAIAPSAPGSC